MFNNVHRFPTGIPKKRVERSGAPRGMSGLGRVLSQPVGFAATRLRAHLLHRSGAFDANVGMFAFHVGTPMLLNVISNYQGWSIPPIYGDFLGTVHHGSTTLVVLQGQTQAQ